MTDTSSSSRKSSVESQTTPEAQKASKNLTPQSKLCSRIPLLIKQPDIRFNIPTLKSTNFVNIVLETGDNESFFRVSDESNVEICRIVDPVCNVGSETPNTDERNGITYLTCVDKTKCCILHVAYPVGLGQVSLLTPDQELVWECRSVVEFICLSIKVKYNFYDAIGNRLMKMTAILPEDDTKNKFVLIVKRSKKEKLALIKMGPLKTCCHIKFKPDLCSELERLQIIATWIGFMHYELKDTESSLLLERKAAYQNTNTVAIPHQTETFVSSSNPRSSLTEDTSETFDISNASDEDCGGSKPKKKVKDWRMTIKSRFSRPQYNHNNNIETKQGCLQGTPIVGLPQNQIRSEPV